MADREVSDFSPLFRTGLRLVFDVVLGHEPSDFGAPNVVSAVFFLGEAEEVVSGGGEHLRGSHRVESSATWQSELGSNTTGSNCKTYRNRQIIFRRPGGGGDVSEDLTPS